MYCQNMMKCSYFHNKYGMIKVKHFVCVPCNQPLQKNVRSHKECEEVKKEVFSGNEQSKK